MTSKRFHERRKQEVVQGGLGPPVEIRREDIGSPAAATLIQALNAELSTRYPEAGANHFRLEPSEVAEGRGAFLIAYAKDEPIGCGAVRRLNADTAEIKRMYVTPNARAWDRTLHSSGARRRKPSSQYRQDCA